jgi:hypothetical protein
MTTKMTPKKPTSSINPDAAAHAATKKAPAKKAPAKKADTQPAPDPDDAYKQLALEWALRRGFDTVGQGMGIARRQVLKDPQLSEDVRRVLLERIDLMG